MTVRIVPTIALAAVLLAGCSPSPAEQPASPAPAPPAPTATAVAPDVPVVSGMLGSAREPVPPVAVSVPSLGIALDVVPVTLADDGSMELPEQPSTAGWYRWGSDPQSATGTTVVAAHVDSARYGLGPFSELKNVAIGETIEVALTDGTTVAYRVDEVWSVGKAALPLDDLFDRDGARRLALITCGGTFDRNAFRYSDNVVAIASPVES